MSKIYVVIGKSASGKDSIFKALKNNNKLNLKKVIGYTTRPIRAGETNGEEYFFVTEEKYLEWKKANKIIESRSYHTTKGEWHYFTVDDGQILLENTNYIMLGTLVSFAALQTYYGAEKIVPIYIEVEDGERLIRSIKREQIQEKPAYAEICRRYLSDAEDFNAENLARSGIAKRYQNYDFDICLNQIIDDIKKL